LMETSRSASGPPPRTRTVGSVLMDMVEDRFGK
jgi:hypothetical protein